MNARGADLVALALQHEGVRFTFGIPGTHNIELYDALASVGSIKQILVTDEQAASFMADGVSRSSGTVGVVNVVPGAGVTHCLSGVAEAYMDNIPLVVLTCGVRSDTGRAYQLHDIDQLALLAPITKACLRPGNADEIYPVIRQAFAIAREGAPGPVAVEIPANYYILTQTCQAPPPAVSAPLDPRGSHSAPDRALLEQAAHLLAGASLPVIYAGNGARGATAALRQLAEKLQAPVATTIQGKGVFPETHPQWLWPGLGASAPAHVTGVERRCDVMLAVGCRFGEVATASYGFTPPEGLIHVDVDPGVIGRNFPARLAIPADAGAFLESLLPLIPQAPEREDLWQEIAAGHRHVQAEALSVAGTSRVTPARLFQTLQRVFPGRTLYVTDSGNGTFLAMEHLRLTAPGKFLAPVDFSCMGYAVPAAIGAKLANPDDDVVCLTGDGAMLMTGLELLTASTYRVAPVVLVLRDGTLGQIAQFQDLFLNRRTCSELGSYCLADLARGLNCAFLDLPDDASLDRILEEARGITVTGRPAVVEVAIDYSRKTYFTRGAFLTTFWRLPFPDKVRMVARAAARYVTG